MRRGIITRYFMAETFEISSPPNISAWRAKWLFAAALPPPAGGATVYFPGLGFATAGLATGGGGGLGAFPSFTGAFPVNETLMRKAGLLSL